MREHDEWPMPDAGQRTIDAFAFVALVIIIAAVVATVPALIARILLDEISDEDIVELAPVEYARGR